MLEDAILDSINVNRAELDRLKRMFEKGEKLSADLQAGVTWHISSTEHRIRELEELNRVLGQVSLCLPEG